MEMKKAKLQTPKPKSQKTSYFERGEENELKNDGGWGVLSNS
jgi:hypothetical protein